MFVRKCPDIDSDGKPSLSSHVSSENLLILASLRKSLYWQNYLKPHACYMYSGMAVRTALAIGLPDSSMPQSIEWQNSARKTWW